MIKSDSKVLPKADDVNAEKTAETVVKIKTLLLILLRLFKYNIHYFFLLMTLIF